MKRERRVFETTELRVEGGDDGTSIHGHAAVFNSLSSELWGFREKIAPGAFKDSLEKDDVRALFNHDPNLILGRNGAGTLRLKEDAHGLAIEIDAPDTQVARDLLVSIRRGDVTQMSFGFLTINDSWGKDWETNQLVRTLEEVELFDVSPVTFPAYPDTDVAVRSMDKWNEEKARMQRAASVDRSKRTARLLAIKAGC